MTKLRKEMKWNEIYNQLCFGRTRFRVSNQYFVRIRNSKSKDRIFYLVMTVVTLIGILGTMYFQISIGI